MKKFTIGLTADIIFITSFLLTAEFVRKLK